MDHDDIDEFKSKYSDRLSDCVFIVSDTLSIKTEDGLKELNIMATDDQTLANIISFKHDGNKVDLPDEGTILLSDRIANAASISAGGYAEIMTSDTDVAEIVVSDVFTNYVYDYAIMSEKTYTDLTGKQPEYSTALAKASEGDVYDIAGDILSGSQASAIMISKDLEKRVDDMMVSLNYIVRLVIYCAFALAFVVLYNLSNINITERTREIATINVLGFYPRETNSYIFRENFILTFAGTLLGLPLGTLLHKFVMSQIRFDMVKFNVHVLPVSYIAAILLTLVFAVMVDLVLRPKVSRIDMAESLKSVE